MYFYSNTSLVSFCCSLEMAQSVALAKSSRKVVRTPQLPAFIFSGAHQTNLTERAASETWPFCEPRMEWDAAKGSPHRVCNISINTLSARAIKPPHSASQPSILVGRWLGGWVVGRMDGCRPSVSLRLNVLRRAHHRDAEILHSTLVTVGRPQTESTAPAIAVWPRVFFRAENQNRVCTSFLVRSGLF
jgi:hypothetical protein